MEIEYLVTEKMQRMAPIWLSCLLWDNIKYGNLSIAVFLCQQHMKNTVLITNQV